MRLNFCLITQATWKCVKLGIIYMKTYIYTQILNTKTFISDIRDPRYWPLNFLFKNESIDVEGESDDTYLPKRRLKPNVMLISHSNITLYKFFSSNWRVWHISAPACPNIYDFIVQLDLCQFQFCLMNHN